MIFLLELAEKGIILSEICKDNSKLQIIYQGVIRKGLVTTDNKVTVTGRNLLNFLKEKAPKEKLSKHQVDSADFEKWWKVYPGTDNFTKSGLVFSGSRTLKKDKENCRLKFNSILSEGEYSCEDLIKALEVEIELKHKESVKSNTNKMSYFQNSLTYLNQRSFEPYIEISKELESIKSETLITLKKGISI